MSEMQASELTIRLLLLFFPGVLCAYLVDALTIHRARSQFEFVLNALIFGISSYAIYWLGVGLAAHIGFRAPAFVFFQALTDGGAVVSFTEVACASAVSVVLGLLLTAASTHKTHFRVARVLKLTRRSGELDVWGFVFNSPEVEWATVRDHAKNLAYDGWVQSFSDDSENAELFLRDVRVYRNDSGEHLYDVASSYLSLKRGEIVIELRAAALEDPNANKTDHRSNDQEGRPKPDTDDATSRTT